MGKERVMRLRTLRAISGGDRMPKPSRSLSLVTSLARGHTEARINVLFGILSNADAPVLARIKAAKMKEHPQAAKRVVPPARRPALGPEGDSADDLDIPVKQHDL
jgi:hypothetical protein